MLFTVPIIDDTEIDETLEVFQIVATWNPAASSMDAGNSAAGTGVDAQISSDDYEITLNAPANSIIEMLGNTADGSSGSAATTAFTVSTGSLSDPVPISFSSTDFCYFIGSVNAAGDSPTVPAGAQAFAYDLPVASIDSNETVTLTLQELTNNVDLFTLGDNGTIAPDSGGTCSGADTRFRIEAAPGFHIGSLLVDGTDASSVAELEDGSPAAAYIGGTYADYVAVPVFVNILTPGTHTITATFTQVIEVTNVSPFGSIDPPNLTTGDEPYRIEVPYDDPSPDFRITANDHTNYFSTLVTPHSISNILVDGIPLPNIQGQGLGVFDHQITPNVIEDHSIEVLFASFVDVQINGPGKVVLSNDTRATAQEVVSTGTNPGHIIVEAPHSDLPGVPSTAVLSLVPDEGYHISSVFLDGVDIGRGSEVIIADILDANHRLEVTYGLDSFVIEAASKYNKLIFANSAETTLAQTVYPDWNATVNFFVRLDDPIYSANAVIIDNLPIEIPAPNGTLNDINGAWTVSNNSSGTQLTVVFANITASHRLEVVDYDASPISDVPLAAAAITAEPFLMFLFDDSGSMNWSIMTHRWNRR